MTATMFDYRRLPGLYRLWDMQFVFDARHDYQVHYAERTEDGTDLYAIYRLTAEPGVGR